MFLLLIVWDRCLQFGTAVCKVGTRCKILCIGTSSLEVHRGGCNGPASRCKLRVMGGQLPGTTWVIG